MMQVAAVGAAASLSLADVNYDDVGKKDGSQYTYMGLLTLLLAATSVILGIMAMKIEGSFIVTASAVITFPVALIVVFQRYKLSRMSTLRDVHNALRQNINRLMMDNLELEKQTYRLSEEAERVSDVEGQLQSIVSAQGGSVGSFIELVREQDALLEAMSQLLIADVAQEIMTIIMRVDRDQNFHLSDMEITELLIRIRTMRGVEDIDEAHLRNVLAGDNGADGIFNVIKAMQENKDTSLIHVSSRHITF